MRLSNRVGALYSHTIVTAREIDGYNRRDYAPQQKAMFGRTKK